MQNASVVYSAYFVMVQCVLAILRAGWGIEVTKGLTGLHISDQLISPRFHERRIFSVTFTLAHLYGNLSREWAWPAPSPIRPVLGF